MATVIAWLVQIPPVAVQPGLPTYPEMQLFERAMSNSPMAAVFLLALWVFRREIKRMMEKDEEKLTGFSDLVSECRVAIATNTLQTEACRRALEMHAAQSQTAAAAISTLCNVVQARIPIPKHGD